MSGSRTQFAYAALIVCALALVLLAQTQPSQKPLTKDDVIQLLKGNVSPKRVEALVRERGIDFRVGPQTETELRTDGATDSLLVVLRDVALKNTVLIITADPGGAQVFVDDELIARVSAEGHLKLRNLKPGLHKVRLSLEGYRDSEQSVMLGAGSDTAVSVVLAAIPTSSANADSTGVSAAAASPAGLSSKVAQTYHKAQAGDSSAMTDLGLAYEYGMGATKDYVQAFNWYTKAAAAGNTRAMNNLGRLYSKGLGVPLDYARAFNWYLTSANAGDPYGMESLGEMYEFGTGVRSDREQAINWYRKAARLGNNQATPGLKRLGVLP